ncbi:hypothetical protein [Bradyrhizobium sp. CB3481]|nr:hypothetical protein [Bradyrhizobium sp. CB3481]WFU14750.1 hypothetical protein QA643_27295 [Bradyrhizobium sp. CB3481]
MSATLPSVVRHDPGKSFFAYVTKDEAETSVLFELIVHHATIVEMNV